MDDLNSLRLEVERLRRAATRKVSRVKARTGARVSGTEFDPRRAPQQHKRYTRKQLETYQSELQSFLSRRNQFVPDASKRPIPRAEWQAYKRREKAYKDVAGKVYEQVKDVELPSGETIAQRLAKMDVLHKHMHNPTVNTIFDPHERNPGDVVSRKALDKLTRDLDRKSKPRNIKTMVRQAREQFGKMMSVVNAPELTRAVEGLSHDQFIALWNHTNFASAIAMSYDSAKKMLSPKEESWGHEKVRQQTNDAMELITWAKGLNL